MLSDNPSRLAGIIDIGSNQVTLKIKENKNGKLNELETLSHPLQIGKDTFTRGSISLESASQLEKIITDYSGLLDSYGPDRYAIVATTALQEASNRDFIIEQLRVKTGKKITVLDEKEAKYLIIREMSRILAVGERPFHGKSLLAYIGTGNLVVSLYEDENIAHSQNIMIGSLKLTEMLGAIQERTENFYLVLEEYLKTFTSSLRGILPPDEIKQFIASGREIELIAELCHTEQRGEYISIPRNELSELYEKVKTLTPEQIKDIYGLGDEAAETLIPSLAIYITLIDFTAADEICALHILISSALLHGMLFPKESKAWNKRFENNTINSAHNIGRLYNYDRDHAELVEKHSLLLFDALKKFYGMKRRERLLLRIAAILHESGKYLSLNDHHLHSYYLIKNNEILGLNDSETEIAALIARYHSNLLPAVDKDLFYTLSRPERLIAARLTAILRIADALNRSHTDKFSRLRINLDEKEMRITVTTDHDIWLEKWAFDKNSEYFSEVFGIKVFLEKESGDFNAFN